MGTTVVDASALIALLAGRRDGWVPTGADDLHAPDVIDTEVVATVRGATLRRVLTVTRAEAMLLDLVSMPITRHRQVPLIPRAWELRTNMSVPDAMYVALAEKLGASLVTTDAGLARAAGRHTDVPVIGWS